MSITPTPLADDTRCPCGTGDSYGACCGPVMRRARQAGTAEALMRSRFTAHVVRDADHLLRTWHPSTSPSYRELARSVGDEMEWKRLLVTETSGGGPFDDEGIVEFTAIARTPEGRRELRERSSFVREKGQWLYVSGELKNAPGRH
ncbi:preprotein translocase subunit SecA [Brachybacterium sp. P6-10-X1]|uniref:YchJ family protein n=1 Tax=Brachybacterium sp. P6-10-X1 TaxID=1903186 RepID=UPI0009719F15|nr:YchJ family metal-binding protein [Brachybacterium sp. P6-10-X1]APX32370.1 preprotein translocase subunit SecA [Brachybacterium sp. P6-10-X1]